MLFGILGSEGEPHCETVRRALEKKGGGVAFVNSNALHDGVACSFDGEDFVYGGQSLSGVDCWFVKHLLSVLPPAFDCGDDYYLFNDWFIDYMQRRERFAFQVSAFLSVAARGVPLVNPPEGGGGGQMKAFQLAAARAVGLSIPETLITNSAADVRQFHAQHAGEVVYKPSIGGGLCRPLRTLESEHLDLLARAPVTFQRRVHGRSIRVTMVGPRVASAVEIASGALDYRDDPAYIAGHTAYHSVELPHALAQRCWALMQRCGLRFSGIDFIHQEDGRYVFLEANTSPAFLDIELKTGAPISDRIAEYMFELANPRHSQRSRSRSFVAYGQPYAPDRVVC